MEIALLIVAVIVAVVLLANSPLARSFGKTADDDHHTTAVRAHGQAIQAAARRGWSAVDPKRTPDATDPRRSCDSSA